MEARTARTALRRCPKKYPSWLLLLGGLLAGCRALPHEVALPPQTSEQALLDRVIPTPNPSPAEIPPEPTCATEANEGDEPLTLAAAIDFALRNNPRLRQEAARVRAVQAGETIAFAPFLPDAGFAYRYSAFNVPVIPGGNFVPASINAGVTNFSIAEAGVQWTLHDFGRTAGRYGQAVSQTQIVQLNLHRAKQTIAFETARAYFRLLSAQAVLRVREEALRQGESILKDTRVRRENGVADREAVLRAEVVVSEDQEELVVARQLVLDAQSALNLVLGRPVTLPVAPKDVTRQPPFTLSLEESLRESVASRAEIGAARAAVAEAAYGVEAAHGEMMPKVFVRGTVIRADSPGPIEGWITGAGLHIHQPLYEGGRRRAEVQRARANVAAATAALQVILDNIANQVNIAYQAVASNRQRIRLGETSVAQAGENLRLTRVKYDNGNATPTDLVDAQTALIRAQTRYFTAIYEYLEGLALLDYTLGGDQRRLLKQLADESVSAPKQEQ